MEERRKRRWCVMDLITDSVTGRLLEPKVWSNIGKASLTFALLYETLHGNLTEFLIITYGTVVIGHESLSRYLRQREDAAHTTQPAAK